jgi:hypothetical protein
MRGKDYSTGLRGVLFEERHYARMGAAIWLYGWLVLRQTHQSGQIGFVLGGAPVRYREIEEETGFNRRTLERWLSTLRRQGYIETTVVESGVSIRIMNAKKFPQGARKSAEGVRNSAGRGTQNCGANTYQNHTREQLANGMGSSFLVRTREKERDAQREIHSYNENQNQNYNQNRNRNQNRSGLSQNQNANQNRNSNQPQNQEQYFLWELRLRQQLLRAERDEAVRRELAVGTGPEVRRT